VSAPSEYSGIGEIPSDLVRVVKGTPDEAELAALLAGIVAARASAGNGATDSAVPGRGATSAWQDRGRRLGLGPRPGGDTWRWSARPY